MNIVKRKMQADLARGPEVYDPYLELESLKHALQQELLAAEALTGIHPETPRHSDLQTHIAEIQRDAEVSRATRRPPPPKGQVLSVNGALEGVSIVDLARGEYMARREVQRMAAIPPIRPKSPHDVV